MIHKHIGYYDGIRGLAVLMVWLSHSSGRGMPVADYLNFAGIGHLGVLLFFVLSGFLLSTSVEDKNYTYKSYIIRRIFRILPLYYIVLIGLYFYQTFFTSNPLYLHIDEGIISFLKHIILIKGDGVFWTLPVEFLFYFILPFITLLVLKDMRWVIVLGVFSIAYDLYHFLIYAGYSHLPGLKIVEITHHSQFISVFIIGVIFGVFSKKPEMLSFYNIKKVRNDVIINILLVLLLVISFLLVSKNLFGLHQPFYSIRFISFLYAIVFSLVLFSLANENAFLRRIFSNKILVFMGKVGFSWYLLHMIVIEGVNHFLFDPWLKFIISTILIAVVSYISFNLIEKPFMAFGKKISKKYTR